MSYTSSKGTQYCPASPCGYGWQAKCTTNHQAECEFKPLLLTCHGQALIFLGSFGDSGDCTVTLDGAATGLPGRFKATNAETGASVARVGNTTFVVPIQKHDFQIIRLESDPAPGGGVVFRFR